MMCQEKHARHRLLSSPYHPRSQPLKLSGNPLRSGQGCHSLSNIRLGAKSTLMHGDYNELSSERRISSLQPITNHVERLPRSSTNEHCESNQSHWPTKKSYKENLCTLFITFRKSGELGYSSVLWLKTELLRANT